MTPAIWAMERPVNCHFGHFITFVKNIYTVYIKEFYNKKLDIRDKFDDEIFSLKFLVIKFELFENFNFWGVFRGFLEVFGVFLESIYLMPTSLGT